MNKIKSAIKICAAMSAVIGFSANASAQETASASASATIVVPISITKDVDMNFGNVAVQSTTGGTVILSTASGRIPSGGITLPPATPGTVTAASFSVAGSGTYTYAITLPSTALTISSGANTMTVTDFLSDPLTTGILTAGAQTLTVGATLNVAAAQPAGVYVSATDFDVTVNYN